MKAVQMKAALLLDDKLGYSGNDLEQQEAQALLRSFLPVQSSADPIVEPRVCPDIFVIGAGPLQLWATSSRLTLFVRQRSTRDGSIENAVVAKIVGSRADMLRIAAAIVLGCNQASTPIDRVKATFVEFLEAPRERH